MKIWKSQLLVKLSSEVTEVGLTAKINSAVKMPSIKTPLVTEVWGDRVVLTLKFVGKIVFTKKEAKMDPPSCAMNRSIALKAVTDLTSNIARVT
jgi:hypothetical protein